MRKAKTLGALLIASALVVLVLSGWPPSSVVLWGSVAVAVIGVYLLSSAPVVRPLSANEIAIASFCTGLSAVIGFFPPFFQVPWMMKIDLVALPWVLCWMTIGTFPALMSALLSVPVVGFLEPFGAGGWVGGISKFLASVWTFLIPAMVVRLGVDKDEVLSNSKVWLLSVALIAVSRSAFMTAFNYYVAIPWYYGIRIDAFIEWLDGGLGLLKLAIPVSGLTLFILEMSVWNSIQAVVEFWAAVLLYRALRGRLQMKR